MWIRTAVPAIEPIFTDQNMSVLRAIVPQRMR